MDTGKVRRQKPPKSSSASAAAVHSNTQRVQHSACGACRMRRVKCNLQDEKQLARSLFPDEPDPYSYQHGEIIRFDGERVQCTNCKQRALRCLDHNHPSQSDNPIPHPPTLPALPLAPIIDAVTGKPKVLRRGKRIAQLQDQYGQAPAPSSSSLILPSSTTHFTQQDHSPSADGPIENLTKEFLKSAFFIRLHVQRPLVHPEEFHRRFLSTDPPRAENLGPVGAILARTMLAWAYSYGVDRSGVEETAPTTNSGRQRRRADCNRVVQACLKEVDQTAIMRKPSYDGVQVLLLILPLTEDVSSPLERLTMYEAVVNQVYLLCSLSTATYEIHEDRKAMQRDDHREEDFLVKVRIYWYCFVHEAIKTGLKGGKLMLDEDDLNEFQNSVPGGMAMAATPDYYQLIAQYATAPIRLALACRRIHSALTGPKARRREYVDLAQMKEAWEALEACSEEFDTLMEEGVSLPMMKREDVERYCDGWKIFMFECHSVVREALLDRMQKLEVSQARVVDVSDPEAHNVKAQCLKNIQRIHMIAEQKCSALARSIVLIVRKHLGSQFFAYDASLVRDGVYYAASVLAADGGTVEEINTCLAALNEMRWAFSKTEERTKRIRSIWTDRLHRQQQAFESAYQQTTSALSAILSLESTDQFSVFSSAKPARPETGEAPLPSISRALDITLHLGDQAAAGGVWASNTYRPDAPPSAPSSTSNGPSVPPYSSDTYCTPPSSSSSGSQHVHPHIPFVDQPIYAPYQPPPVQEELFPYPTHAQPFPLSHDQPTHHPPPSYLPPQPSINYDTQPTTYTPHPSTYIEVTHYPPPQRHLQEQRQQQQQVYTSHTQTYVSTYTTADYQPDYHQSAHSLDHPLPHPLQQQQQQHAYLPPGNIPTTAMANPVGWTSVYPDNVP